MQSSIASWKCMTILWNGKELSGDVILNIFNIFIFTKTNLRSRLLKNSDFLNVNLSSLSFSVCQPFFLFLSLQLPEEVSLQSCGPDIVPASDPGSLRDPVLLCGRVYPVQPGYKLPSQGQPCWKLHPAVSDIWFKIINTAADWILTLGWTL